MLVVNLHGREPIPVKIISVEQQKKMKKQNKAKPGIV